MLNQDERAILFQLCSDHPVAYCRPCGAAYRFTELAADFIPPGSSLCRECLADLTESLRDHLRTCPKANWYGRTA
jgi:hypothetical protein